MVLYSFTELEKENSAQKHQFYASWPTYDDDRFILLGGIIWIVEENLMRLHKPYFWAANPR